MIVARAPAIKYLKVVGVLIIFLLLSVLTQVGGLIFLLSLLLSTTFFKNFSGRWSKFLAKIFTFVALYLLFVFYIIPMIARPLGRVQLPLFKTRNLQPAVALTFFLNRNYVRPQLQETAFKISEILNKEFPGTTVNYLDGNFPFMNGFPLLPHLSHHDGKKLDFSFSYTETRTTKFTNEVPSIIGYGVCEAPRSNEENMPETCAQKGYWQYNFLQRIIPQGNKTKFGLDESRTKRLVELFAGETAITRVFIEPHLKTRLRLDNPKVLFHGCHAVRHDDHFHVQIN